MIAVIGAGSAPAAALKLAHEVGREIARRRATLINGGRSGVMEAAAGHGRPIPVVVVRADFGWSDVGNWASVADLWRRDGARNAVRGRAVVIDSVAVSAVTVLTAKRWTASYFSPVPRGGDRVIL